MSKTITINVSNVQVNALRQSIAFLKAFESTRNDAQVITAMSVLLQAVELEMKQPAREEFNPYKGLTKEQRDQAHAQQVQQMMRDGA